MPYPKNRTIVGKQNYAKRARIQSNEGVNENEQDNNNDFNLNDLNTSLDDNYSQHSLMYIYFKKVSGAIQSLMCAKIMIKTTTSC